MQQAEKKTRRRTSSGRKKDEQATAGSSRSHHDPNLDDDESVWPERVVENASEFARKCRDRRLDSLLRERALR